MLVKRLVALKAVFCSIVLIWRIEVEMFDSYHWENVGIKLRLAPWNWFKPPSKTVLLTVRRGCFFCGSFLLFMFRVCYSFLSVHCSLVATCWEKGNLLVLLCVMFCCVVVIFPCGILARCVTWLYRLMLFASLLTFSSKIIVRWHHLGLLPQLLVLTYTCNVHVVDSSCKFSLCFSV